ncbi:MAG: VanZ family protein [Desulfacinum sp.]|jgi:hypothetical protein|nr:VanZ family protein [Desulfacinum sp.]MBZ4658267.1 hypothetical protein [Desulfacinum sp.]
MAYQPTKKPPPRQTVNSSLSPTARKRPVGIASFLSWNGWNHLALLFAVQALVLFVYKAAKNQAGNLDVRWALSALAGGGLFCLAAGWRSRKRKDPAWARFVPAVFYGLFIYCLSGQSLEGVELPIPGDFFHPLEYASLGIFLGWGWSKVLRERKSSWLFVAVLGTGGLYALTDEWHQSWVPGRVPSFTDLSWDLVGLALGAALVLWMKRVSPGWRSPGI